MLSAMLFGTIGLSFTVILREASSTYMRSSLRQDGLVAIERLTRELNEAKEITSAEENSLSFWWQDTDSDGLRDASEVAAFSWDGSPGSTLKRDSVSLAFNVESFQITYRDLNNSLLSPSPDLSLADRDSIRRIEVELNLDQEDENITLVTAVIPRNLRQVRGPW